MESVHADRIGRWRSRFGELRELVRQWYRTPFAPLFLSWKVWSRDECFRIHRWARAAAFPRHPSVRWTAMAAAAVLWPLRSPFLVHKFTRAYGPGVQAREGRPVWRQQLEQLRLAWTHSISPYDYYTFALHRPERYARATRFVFSNECGNLLRALNEHRDARSLGDKVAFAAHLRERGLPTAPTLAWTERGRLVFPDDAGPALPPADLFVKPVAAFGGQGAMLWEHLGGDLYASGSASAFCATLGIALPRVGDATVLHRSDLCDLLARLSSRMEMMVQRRLANHPEVAELSTGALLCARILTGAVDGRAEFIRGVLKMPLGRSVVVNFGIVAPIDEATGTLGAAVHFGPDATRFTTHPETDARIEGRRLPHWDRIRSVAVAAHETLPEYTFVGWDIAVTPDGVVVLEGNAGWGAEALQKPHGSPLMDTRFTAICLQRIAQLRRGPTPPPRRGAAPAPEDPRPVPS